ncbi:hypothetical protein [Chryseobacterium wanjuense]
MLQFTTNKAKSLNMGVDMSVGTGWPIGSCTGEPTGCSHKNDRSDVYNFTW